MWNICSSIQIDITSQKVTFFTSFASKFCTSTKKKPTGDKPWPFCQNQSIPCTKKCDSKTSQAIAIPNSLHRRGSESQTRLFLVNYSPISEINRGLNLKWLGSKEVDSEDRFLLREKEELRFRFQLVVRLMGWDCKTHKLLYWFYTWT